MAFALLCDTPFRLGLVGNSFPVAGLPSSSRIKTPFSIPVTAQIGIYEYVQLSSNGRGQ